MYLDAERRLQELLNHNQHFEGVTFKMKDDPRVTKVGKWLRRSSMDELPQLFTCCSATCHWSGRGRRCREKWRYTLRRNAVRLMTTPGINLPLADRRPRRKLIFQVKCSSTFDISRARLSGGDVKILLKTIPAVLSGKRGLLKMKALLICPADRPGVELLAESTPLVLVPLLGKTLLDYWLDHLSGQGVKQVCVLATDRPDQLRAWLGDVSIGN